MLAQSEDPAVMPNPFQPREHFGREGARGMAGTDTAMIQLAGDQSLDPVSSGRTEGVPPS